MTAIMAAAAGLLVAPPARAASLQAVSTSAWASGVPSYISMYIYVPDTLATPPPIMVASHYCGGNATAYFSYVSTIVSLADQYGFIMIFPQTTNNCWDVGSTQSLTRDGGGDTQALVEMVTYTVQQYNADASRVYAMGSSSGAMMTEALMGLYPDVFKAGAEMSGVPDGCWAVDYTASDQWSSPCATGTVSMTAQQWGDIVFAQYPGYTGPRPRLWLWVGTADTTISPNNFSQAILEWTDVLGLSSTPTSTETPQTGYTGQLWSNACGLTALEAWTLQGGGHAPVPTTQNASDIVSFFALDQTGPDPGAAGCTDGGTGASSSESGDSDGGTAAGSSSGTSSGGGKTGGGTSSGSQSGATSGGAASAGSVPDGGASGSSNGASAAQSAAGCGCHLGAADDRFGGLFLAPLGAVLGIVLRRRRRRRA